jgi:hypothetical protein
LFLGSHLWLQNASTTGKPERWSAVAAGLFVLAMVLSVGHPDLRRMWTFALVALSAATLYRARSLFTDVSPAEWYRRPVIRHLSTALAVVAVLTYLTMGIIRETARRPDTVRNVISLQDEARQPAMDRPGAQVDAHSHPQQGSEKLHGP